MSVTVDTGMTPVGIAAILAGTRTGHDDRRQAGEGSRRGMRQEGWQPPGQSQGGIPRCPKRDGEPG